MWPLLVESFPSPRHTSPHPVLPAQSSTLIRPRRSLSDCPCDGLSSENMTKPYSYAEDVRENQPPAAGDPSATPSQLLSTTLSPLPRRPPLRPDLSSSKSLSASPTCTLSSVHHFSQTPSHPSSSSKADLSARPRLARMTTHAGHDTGLNPHSATDLLRQAISSQQHHQQQHR